MSHYVFSWFAVPPFFTALCSLLVGHWVLYRERPSHLGEVVYGGTVVIAVWLGAFGMMYLATDAPTALLWARIAHVAVPLLPVAIYLYITIGLRQMRQDKILAAAAVLTAFTIIIIVLTSKLLVADVHEHWWGYYPSYGPVGPVLAGYFALVILVALSKLWVRLTETAKGTVFRHRAAMSALAGVVAAITSVDFLVAFGVNIYPFGYAPVLVFLGVVLVMEWRHRIVYMTPAVAADQILTTMQGAILVASARGVVEVGNRAARQLLGYSEAELLDLPLDRVFASGPEWRTLLRECLAGEAVQEIETAWIHKGGDSVDVSISASLIRGGGDQPSGLIIAAVDITNRKRSEEALRQRDEQLRQSQKMEAIGQLAGGIAHDFNNLLTAIIGNSSLALTTMAHDDPNRPLVSDIHEVAERAAALTRQILAFSRRQMLRPQVLCLNRVITDMESLLRRSLGEDIELDLVLAPDLKDSEIDAHQITQVVLNLAVNARDAMPDGGRLVIETTNASLDSDYTRAHRETRPGEYVMLAMSDTGIGMDKETQAHAFEPFFTTKGVGRGTGLGLSTVFGIVKQSDGNITVYSEPGEGTTFKIYLPVARRSAAAGVKSGDAEQALVESDYGKVLVVEDEAPVRRLVVRVLSKAGYQVKAAASYQEAETIVGDGNYLPNLLLTDIVLPGGVNGRQVAEAMLQRFPDLTVIFMSGYTRNAVVHNGRVDNEVAFLEKPFNPEMLLRKIREALPLPSDGE